LRGRYFTEEDDSSKPRLVIINRTLAEKYFSGEDPIGKKIGNYDLSKVREIVGVVDDIREGGLDEEIWPAIYLPFNQEPGRGFTLLIRTSQDAGSIFSAVRAVLRGMDPGIATDEELTMNQNIDNSTAAYMRRSTAWLADSFATLAFVLVVVGLYSVITYSVSQRTREIGVRMALGAQRRSVYQLILREAGWLSGIGIACGLLCSLGVTSLMSKLLFGVHPWDVSTLFLVSAVLAVSALLASYFPARRAASVNPVEALRAE
jgi:predicted permease